MATTLQTVPLRVYTPCLKCRLIRFAEGIDLEGTHTVKSSLHGLFSIQKQDGMTSLLALRQGTGVKLSPPEWKNVFWETSTTAQEQGGMFYMQDKKSTVMEYLVEKDGVTLRRQLEFKPLQKAIENYSQSKVSTIRLVGFERGYLLFIVNSDTLCTAEIIDNVCLPRSWIPLPSESWTPQEGGTMPFVISADIIVVLDKSAQLLCILNLLNILYNLHNGLYVCQIDLEPAGFPSGNSGGGDDGQSSVPTLRVWCVSPSLDTLVWLDSSGILHSLDIENYVRSRPGIVTLPDDSHALPFRQGLPQKVRTCRAGNFSWRHVLVDLHRQEVDKSATSVWSSQKLSSPIGSKATSKVQVSGFQAKQGAKGERRGRADTGSSFAKRFSFPSGSLLDVGYRVVDSRCSPSTVVLVLVSGADCSQRALCLVDILTQQVYFHNFPTHHYPVLPTAVDLPILVLSPDGLLLLVPPSDVKQEDIVSKMMVYSGAQSADHLCLLNGWGRTTVPLHTLLLSLRQHQLDTVTFFLCSKENLFSATKTQPASATQHKFSSITPSAWAPNTHYNAVCELAPAFDLFLKAIHDDITSSNPAQEFTHQLLSQSLEFLHTLLKDGLVLQSSLSGTGTEVLEKEDVERALATVMEYIAQMREALVALEQKQRKVGRFTMDEVWRKSRGTDDTDGAAKTWSDDIEESVEKACQENNVGGLQAHLLRHGQNGAAQWSQLVRIGLQRAWSHLQNKDIPSAQSIINSLGLDVAKTVWELSQFTTDRQLQRYIIHELRAAATLSPEDISLVEFLEKLYTVYPATSVKSRISQDSRMAKAAKPPLAAHLRQVETDIRALVHDVEGSTVLSPDSDGPYCVMALRWLHMLDTETQERLLIDAAVLTGDSDLDAKFPARYLWRYWLSRNDAHQAVKVLERALSSHQDRSCLADFMQDLPCSAGFIQRHIKVHLMRQEDRMSEVLHSLDMPVEEQIHMLQGLLHLPHPLHRCGDRAVSEFHRQFAAYCAHYGFVVPLWRYCSVHGLDVESLLDLEPTRNVSWFKPFLYLHTAVQHPDDTSQMFAASLSVARVHWKPDDWTLAHLLREGHVTAAVATLAYLPKTEGESGGAVCGVDPELLRSSLQRFPKLLMALLPPDTDTTRFDVNVYQLLRDNAPLDCRRLFGWQSTNVTASEDGMKSLPYFSHSDLVSHFAHTAKLNFTYYLRHGRPSYAFLSFLSEELDQKTTTLSPKRVQGACGIALWLAAKHFHNARISSACVAFVEMLSLDSTVLRAYIQAGETLLAHSMRSLSGPVDKRKEQSHTSQQEVVSLLHSCLRNKHRHGRRLLTCLEDAVSEEITSEGLSSTSVEAALKWNMVILMCNHLRLPLTSRFLEACARDDRWLPFIWFAQLHQYPKSQLRNLLHQFPSRHLRDHLHYIINNASSNTVTSSSSAADVKQGAAGAASQDGSHNPRSSLYFRIGVRASSDRGDVSSDEEELLRRDSTTYPSSAQSPDDEDVEVTAESSASDVFRVIFSALATGEPWKSLLLHALVLRNPLFAELAGCCGAPMVPSLCAWLAAMLSPAEHARFVEIHGKRASKWTMVQLERLVDAYLECHTEKTLSVAFSIFQPTSPLLPFLQFISECVMWRNYEGCKAPLDSFKELMAAVPISQSKTAGDGTSDTSSCKSGNTTASTASGQDPTQEVIGDRDWLEGMAYRIIRYELLHCGSLYEALHLLDLLAEENIALVFSFDVLDFGKLHRMVELLHRHQVSDVTVADFFDDTPNSQSYNLECQRALECLMAQGAYEDAYAFGQSAGLDLSGVVLKQVSSEKQQLQETGVWASGVTRRRYWMRCAALVGKHGLTSDTVAHFFQREAAETQDLDEKAFIFKLSLSHAEVQSKGQESPKTATLKDAIFTAMWQCRIQARVLGHKQGQKAGQRPEEEDIFSDTEELEASAKGPIDRKELLHSATVAKPHVDPANELNSEEAMELEKVMVELLAEGRVSECCRLARTLGGQCTDLVIVLTCIGLSKGEVTVNTLDASSRILLTAAEKRRSLASLPSFARSSTLSLASAAPSWSFLPPEQEEIICTMERLLARCGRARPCCLRIISIYKIACLIGRAYADVVESEEFSVLRELLKTDFPHRYSLAAEFLSTSSLTDKEVASFLVDEIVKSLRIYLGGKDGFEIGSAARGQLDTSELIFRPTEGGEVFSQLVSLCGEPAILGDKLLNALATMADHSPEPSQSVLSMETELLIMAHECHTAACNMDGISNVLRAARVCAQCLASASQYQLMIRLLTGIGRYSEMTYIFDQLQQHHQFEMLLRKGIDKEDKLKIALLDYLKRFHSDDKETYSMVALNFTMYREIADMLDESGHRHMAMLKDKPLESSKEVQETLKKCIQYFGDAAESYVKAFVVTEAYGKAVDWAEGLFQHVIVNGDMRYLQDMRTYVKLTPALVENTLYKLKQLPNKQSGSLPHVKKLLKYCPDVWMQYKIAQDLGLQDIVRELIRSDSCSSYIKDMLATH
ncbi:hypothetical protein BaRGS_00005050 [Batillaria attramentaria]|uniref:Spatacsin C-terminal domain-containing protein n=1 Tax=Batillaria attramentaria TaxID=370345 RepID=A0ABD0LWH2_9CAEN